MTQVTHRTAPVVIPPGSAWPPIRAIRAEHGREVGRWMPHITLVSPFLPAAEFEPVAGRPGPVCEALRPFELRLAPFDTFGHHRDNPTAWLSGPSRRSPCSPCSRHSGRRVGRGKRPGPPGAASART